MPGHMHLHSRMSLLDYQRGGQRADLKVADEFFPAPGAFDAALAAGFTSIQLVDLTAEDQKKLESGKSRDGRPMKMTLKHVKKLVVKTATKTASSNSTGSSESFVAEHQGKLVIPVPGAAK